ncbi:MAG: CinA family protein [Gammaproteobacteria bacterium]|nr:CinA family protein [Gammaproteobacteria bacterium]
MIEKIKQLVLETAEILTQQQLMLATAESCTGGGLSYWLTSVPGSSAWFDRGFVTYSNAAKIDMLEIETALLQQFGAVSQEIACDMAQKTLQKSLATVSIAITGIAGPEGGSEQKPVGTVWIAWGRRHHAPYCEKNIFAGDRQQIRLATIAKALEKLVEMISLHDKN